MSWNHVYPLNDLREHELSGKNCWCHPHIDEEDSIVIHNALDKREQLEQGLIRAH